MPPPLTIRPLQSGDINRVTDWARAAGFCPGDGDVGIYCNTDRQGLWVGWLEREPIGCIAGVRYSQAYGFIGLFIVTPLQRRRGYGLQLWRHALDHLADVACVGLEAAPDRIADYGSWGFRPASTTSRWHRPVDPSAGTAAPGLGSESERGAGPLAAGASGAVDPGAWDRNLTLIEAAALPERAVLAYDAAREPSPRPHFLRDWLHHPAGTVLTLVDQGGQCHGFGRIRPCLLPREHGWRIGPLLADTPALAERLLLKLMARHPGDVLLDAPGANPAAAALMEKLGFTVQSQTLRMYRGDQPVVGLADVYGLACLELG
jgi:ribosomal-protein-alanine N-acetyltransferase